MKKIFPEEIYQKMKICDLILVAFYNLEAVKKKVTFERLLKECFDLFPKKFNFSKYPKWPDARKLDRPLRTLRQKRIIFGNPKENFSLTKKGKKMALEVMSFLKQKKLKLK